MGPGGIAAIIASLSLFVIAVALSYAVVRLGKLIDEGSLTLKTLTEETAPLIQESTRTVELVNGPLESINRMTKNVENVTEKMANAAENFTSKTGPALKALSFLASAATAKKKRGKKAE